MKTTNPSDHKNVVSEKNGKALLHIIDPLCNFEVGCLITQFRRVGQCGRAKSLFEHF